VVEFPELPPGLRKMYRLTCHDARMTNFYTVLTPQISTRVKVNAKIAIDGVFLKRYPFWSRPDPKKPGFWQWTPLLVAEKAYSHWEPYPGKEILSHVDEKPIKVRQTVERLDTGFLERRILDVSKSGKGFRSLGPMKLSHAREARRLPEEKKAFEHLFGYVHHFTPAELQAKVDPRLAFENLMVGDRAPEWAKWKIAEVDGYARYVETLDIAGLESGIDRIHILVVTDTGMGNFEYNWSVALLNLPHPLREGDRVRARGVFCKLYPYRSKKNEWRWTPLVVAPRLEKVPPPSRELSAGELALVAGLLLAAGGAVYLLTRRDDERRGRIREQILERRAARDAIRAVRKRKSENGQTPGPDTPDDAPAPPGNADGGDPPSCPPGN
jgi:hypothetical protein